MDSFCTSSRSSETVVYLYLQTKSLTAAYIEILICGRNMKSFWINAAGDQEENLNIRGCENDYANVSQL